MEKIRYWAIYVNNVTGSKIIVRITWSKFCNWKFEPKSRRCFLNQPKHEDPCPIIMKKV